MARRILQQCVHETPVYCDRALTWIADENGTSGSGSDDATVEQVLVQGQGVVEQPRIDTVGSVELNGVHLGDVASQFTPHRFDVRSVLRPGVTSAPSRNRTQPGV